MQGALQDVPARAALPPSAFGGLEMFSYHAHPFQQRLGQALGALERGEPIPTKHLMLVGC